MSKSDWPLDSEASYRFWFGSEQVDNSVSSMEAMYSSMEVFKLSKALKMTKVKETLFSGDFYKRADTNFIVKAVISALQQGESPYKIIEDLCRIK